MNKYIYSTLLGLCILFTPHASALERCKVLTATSSHLNPPYSWREGNTMVGALPDVLHAIAQELGLSITIHYSGAWKRAQTNVALGHLDLLAGIYKSDERVKKYDYTIDVFDYAVVVATHKNKASIYDGTWKSLIGHRGIIPQGSSAGNKFDLYMETHFSVQAVPRTVNMVRQLIRNSTDYVIAGRPFIEQSVLQIEVANQIHISDTPILIKPLHIVFSKKSPCKHLVQPFNQAIKSLKAKGVLAKVETQNKHLMLRNTAKEMLPNPTSTQSN